MKFVSKWTTDNISGKSTEPAWTAHLRVITYTHECRASTEDLEGHPQSETSWTVLYSTYSSVIKHRAEECGTRISQHMATIVATGS